MGNKPRYTFEECQEIAKKYDSCQSLHPKGWSLSKGD